MGEYPRADYHATLTNNPATIAGTVDRTKTTQDPWIECFRIVDTVLTKVMCVQRLHMDLICDFVAFSDTGNRKETLEKQKNECERLEDEMKFLKKTMLERVQCSEGVTLLRSTETNASPFRNIGSSSERDLQSELKRENDLELMRGNENSMESLFSVKSEHSWNELESFSPSAGEHEKDIELSCTSDSAMNQERDTVGPTVFVDTDAFAISKFPAIVAETSYEEEVNIMREILQDNYENSCEAKPTVYQSERYDYGTGSEYFQSSTRMNIPENKYKNEPESVQMEDFDIFKVTVEQKVSAEAGSLELRKDYSSGRNIIVKRSPIQPSTENSYKCEVCGRAFTRNGDLTRHKLIHIRDHNGEKPHKCETCSMKFSQKCNLVEHMRTHNDEKPYTCELCSKTFTRSGNLAKHMRIHNDEKPYECKVCKNKFRIKSHLTLHKRTHSGEKPYECASCSKKFKVKANLIYHVRRHYGNSAFECEVCFRQFIQKSHLIYHLRIHNGEKPYECGVCGKKCRQRSNLTVHMRVHNGEKPYECEVCGRKFSETGSVTKHMRIHNGERPYECEICGRKFSGSGSLTRHLRIHNDKKPYECDICARKFRQKGCLFVHLRTHNGEKPYECEVCSKTFTANGTLTNHMRVHSGEKPFECKVCGKEFSLKTSLVCHLRIHSGEKPYDCEFCDRKFRQRSTLLSHIRKVHHKSESNEIELQDGRTHG